MSKRFVTTHSFLDQILAAKVRRIQALSDLPGRVAELERAAYATAPGHDSDSADRSPRDFHAALQRETVALIAEVKKTSPGKGVLSDDLDPVALAKTYAGNGAATISVITDEYFFQGSLDYLRQVRAAVDVPVLQKDFIIDPVQVYEGRIAGADAMLLIVAALTAARLTDLHALITALGMAALVEVHNKKELERALKLGARLIGINNRNLKTFCVDLETTARLARYVPKAVTLVAESGLQSGADVYRLGQLGARAVLVGEALVRAEDIPAAVREFSSQKREIGR